MSNKAMFPTLCAQTEAVPKPLYKGADAILNVAKDDGIIKLFNLSVMEQPMKIINNILLLVLVTISMGISNLLYGSGGTIHMYVADEAMDKYITIPELKNLLQKQRDAVRAGSWYPDGGYFLDRFKSNDPTHFGEIAHWAEFLEYYLHHIRDNYHSQDEEYDSVVAHFLGAASHSMEDQLVDNSFFNLTLEADGYHQQLGDVGYDVFAITDHKRWYTLPHWFTPTSDLVEVYDKMDVDTDRMAESIKKASALLRLSIHSERAMALSLPYYQKKLRWGRRLFYSAPTGLAARARIIARYWEALWRRLHHEESRFFIGSFPAGGHVAMTGKRQSLGSRIHAIFSRGIDRTSLTANTIYLQDQNGVTIPTRIHSTSGNFFGHLVYLRPLKNLASGDSYTVTLKADIRDFVGNKLGRDHRFSFRIAPKTKEPFLPLEKALRAALHGPRQNRILVFGHHWNVAPITYTIKRENGKKIIKISGVLTRNIRVRRDTDMQYKARFEDNRLMDVEYSISGDKPWQKAARKLALILIRELKDHLLSK